MDKVQQVFESRFYILDSDDILKLNDNTSQGEINNVVTGLEEIFYSLKVVEDEINLKYHLIFGINKDNLSGFLLELDTTVKERDELTFMYAVQISLKHKELNTIDIFNAFQRSVRSMFEMYGFFTYNPRELKGMGNNPTMLVKGKRGVIGVLEIKKEEFYKEFFEGCGKDNPIEGNEHVYLMYNKRSNLIKIGQSVKPSFREKTLQSEEPEILLLCTWEAPKMVERELHSEFRSQRKRGEWFDLSFKDLEKIKNKMSKYN
jgi:hypothetical protein